MQRCPLIVVSVFLFVASLAISGRVAAQALLQPEDVANLATVSDPRLSPDGRRVLYVQRVPRDLEEERGPDASRLLLVSSSGGDPIPFTSSKGHVSRPRWSPDGRHVAFLDKRPADDKEAKTQIFVMPIDGGEARRVSDSEESVTEIAWDRSGEALYYTSREPQSEAQKEAEKKGRDWEVFDRDERHEAIYRVSLDGSGEERVSEEGWTLRQIAVSPDGRRLVALGARSPKVDDSYVFVELVTVDTESGAVTTVWDMPGKAAMPRFSPDGEWLGVLAGIAARDPLAASLFVVPLAGGAARNLTPDYPGSLEWFEFDGDGGIVFSATHGTSTHLRRVDLESGDIESIVEGGPVYTRAHLDAEASLIVAAANSPRHPPEILVHEIPAGGWRRLTNSYPQLETITLGRQESIEWRARDGLRIEGVLVYPVGYVEGATYPLVVGVHGGPEGAIRNGWHTGPSYLSQLLAHRGAFFLLPNYRGSSGRGVSYLLADHGDPAGAEFQDVLDGIQHLADRGLIDKDRVGIMGGSYGGYFSAWAATKHSSWFRASVVNYGVSNLYSDWGDGDIPWEHRLVHWGWFPVDRPLLAMDRSPVTWVRGSTTATLIMHGKADSRVPAAQSRELYNGLRLNEDLDVEFVLFPREGHGYRESPHRLEACRRALAWLVEHLGLIQTQTDISGGP